jgi:hypothetical protein
MSDEGLKESIEAVRGLILPLKEGEFSGKLYKVLVYVESVEKSWSACCTFQDDLNKEGDMEKRRTVAEAKVKGFEASLKSSLRFARINLDAAMVGALEKVAKKPKAASKADEKRKSEALQRAFDGISDPTKAMQEHFRSTSDPLDKYLVAGPWGFEYLTKRQIETEHYYEELCGMLSCEDSASGKVVLSYGKLNRAIDAVEELAMKAAKEGKANFNG